MADRQTVIEVHGKRRIDRDGRTVLHVHAEGAALDGSQARVHCGGKEAAYEIEELHPCVSEIFAE